MTGLLINCDLGEDPALVWSGAQEALLPFVMQASVACGGHAGDDDTMAETVRQCARHGVMIGAHPSYPDRAHFGRQSMALPLDALRDEVRAQVQRLVSIAGAAGARVAYVKPHGALYHDAGRDPARAAAVADALVDVDPTLAVLLAARAPTAALFVERGFTVWAEAFADRAYEPDGSLRARSLPGALLDEASAAAQAKRIAAEGWASSLCVHSDTPGALAIVRAVRAAVG